MKKTFLSAAAVMAGLALAGSPAMAQSNEIVIGITVTTTGPAAALGIPERNSLDFVPKEIGGVPLKLIVLDDGGDPTTATTNARRFVTESKADLIMGSSTTPPLRSPPSPTRRAFRISAWRLSRSTRRARSGRSPCRSRSRSWARCCTST